MKINQKDINKAVKYLSKEENSGLLHTIIIGIVIITILILILVTLDYSRVSKESNISLEEYLYSKSVEILQDTDENGIIKSSANGKNTSSNDEVKANGKITNLKVKRVVDGDTMVLEKNNTEYKVRLIGVNTPESVHLDSSKNTEEGKVASEFSKKYLDGKTVDIEFDAGPQDRYGRYLVYMYVDGISFNELLLEEGMAEVMFISPNVKNRELYKQIESVAKSNKVGIWKNSK